MEARAPRLMSANASEASVTVIVPCYNHERFVAKAVASVLEQTYRNIQLVAIDDGSRDRSAEILADLAERHGFDLICQQNQGICRALNRAISERARGDFIALLASDDLWHPEKVALQLAALAQEQGSEFCFSQAIEFEDEGRRDFGRVFPKKPLHGDVLKRVVIRQHVPAGTMLFSRRLYDEVGGFDETLKEEDWDFVIRCAAKTRFAAVEKPLLYYRSHAGSTMRTRDRTAIFHQKAKILAKNFDLMSPWRWLLAVLVHFAHDIVLVRSRARKPGGGEAT